MSYKLRQLQDIYEDLGVIVCVPLMYVRIVSSTLLFPLCLCESVLLY